MNGKGDRPRNNFSQAFRDNYDFIFGKKPTAPTQTEHVCAICQAEFPTLRGLVGHQRKHAPKPEPIVCPTCGKICGNAGSYEAHARAHLVSRRKVHRKRTSRLSSYDAI